MGKVLGLTKNNDQYEDVPDELKWAIPLHEHLTSFQVQEHFKARKVLSEQRVRTEFMNQRSNPSAKRKLIFQLDPYFL